MKPILKSAKFIFCIIHLCFSTYSFGQSLLRDSLLFADRFLDASVVSKLPAGTPVIILQSSAGWTQIRSGEMSGWIRASNLDGPKAAVSVISQMQNGRLAANNLLVASGIRGTPTQQANTDTDILPVTVPYMSRRFLLIEGHRSLYLSWQGGKPPYKLRLVRQADGQEILALSDLQERHTVTPEISLLPGDYSIEFQDDGRTAYEDLLRVVPAERLPTLPETGSPNLLSEDKSAALYAIWLTGIESGRWIIEAMQQLHRLSGKLPEAVNTLNAIERGAHPDVNVDQ